MRNAAALLLVVAACSAPPSPSSEPPPSPAPPSTNAAERSSSGSVQAPATLEAQRGHDDPACAGAPSVEPVIVPFGETARTGDKLAVTYSSGVVHDHYEGGRSDTMIGLTFQGIMADGGLTPSAFTWRPSILAPPHWAHLGSMPFCVRISNVQDERVTVELFRRSRR